MNVVYQYSAKAPIQNADYVRDQMARGVRYYRAMVASGMAERAHRDWLDRQNSPELVEIASQLAVMNAPYVLDTMPPAERRAQRAAQKALVARKVAILKGFKPIREADPRYARLHKQRLACDRMIRSVSGLHFGTYCALERAASMAISSGRGDGRTTSRLVGWWSSSGVPVAGAAAGGNRQLEIDIPDAAAWARGKTYAHGERRRLQHTTMRVRVGSIGRDPLWCEIPIRMHRPLPTGIIREVRVFMRTRPYDRAEEWKVDILMRVDDPPPVIRQGIVAVMVEDLTVKWLDSKGVYGELHMGWLPPNFEVSEDLRQKRDVALSATRRTLASWRDAGKMPPPIAEMAINVAYWRSYRRMYDLVRTWKAAAPDCPLASEADAWRTHDQHLWEWEWEERRNAIRRRKNAYRHLARTLANSYAGVVLPARDLSRTARKDKGTEPNTIRVIMAEYELRQCLSSAFRSSGGSLMKSRGKTLLEMLADGDTERVDLRAPRKSRADRIHAAKRRSKAKVG